ncbi:MAG TPA: hypothetical protein VMR74_06445, partial [Gammaproteobacteria bacterium]|nr:hypothetical protein [Gammaproteobacteria bacterium]
MANSSIRLFDDLTNRIRWAEGTLSTVLEDENLDPPVIDAISSAVHHLTEVRQIVEQFRCEPGIVDAYKAWRADNPEAAATLRAKVFADADGNGANARLLKAGDDELRAACLELAAEKHGNGAPPNVPPYRLAHEAPDWSDDAEAYDCMTLVVGHIESLLKASHHDGGDFEPSMVYLAQHELQDLRAILDTWLSQRQKPGKVRQVDAVSVPAWLAKLADEAGCTVTVESCKSGFDVWITENPDGPGILGA